MRAVAKDLDKMIATWGANEDALMQEYKGIRRRPARRSGMPGRALVVDANILARAAPGEAGARGSNSVRGNETPILREFRSQPPNCGVALASVARYPGIDMRTSVILGMLSLSVLPVRAQGTSWKKLEFLLGTWTGSAGQTDTQLGAGQGGFSFELELNRKIIVRRNHAGYASGVEHDDLMVIYLDAPDDTPRAMFFDTEGHVIRYNLAFPSSNKVTFESDGTPAGLRYRLSYWLNGHALDGKFEVAPPGSEYKTYMSWTSKKE